ncbi:MAG: thiamine-phosphate kinase [Candidatus Rokubacteria bacterium]|nr:thiamine-phosphate kinase [Candidatus Rokubacteria bacterium]
MTADLTERGVIDTARRAAGVGTGVRTGIGDDCAVLEPDRGELLLATTDLMIEDVHFRRRYAEPADIGWKSLAVNLSDIASMGGRPRWALVALACPEGTTPEEIEAFYEGLHALAAEHGVAVVGGDTSSSPRGWTVNVTVLGGARRPRLRSTARAGDLVAVTGPLGRSAAGLAVLEGGAPAGVPAAALADVTGAHLRPSPRVREGRWLGEADGVTAMIDLSDGLTVDVGHLAEESGLGARVELSRVPVSDATRRVAEALRVDPLPWATGGGEDYELLLTCAPGAVDALREGLARATGTELTIVGAMVAAAGGVTFVDAAGRVTSAAPGWQHFVAGRPT